MAEVADRMIEEARELVSNRLLWPLVRDFLWDFAPSIHESWIEEKVGSLEGWKFGSFPSRVKRYILEALNVEPCFHTFPKEDGSRLLLLEGATLESVVKWLGALACAAALRRVTHGATVRELKATLPGIYPEVFGYTMYFGSLDVQKFEGLDDGKFGGADVEKVGCELLLQSLSSLPVPLMHRLKLKLPKRMADMERPNLQTSKLPNFQTSIFKLLKLKFPEAYKLCCS